MSNKIFLGLSLVSSLVCVPFLAMEKPAQNKAQLTSLRASIALKAADACYFGLDNQEQDFDKACQLYKDAAHSDTVEGFIARYMLTVMAYANQGGLSKIEWKEFANIITKHSKNGKAPELEWDKHCARIARILKIEQSNLLKITLNFEHLAYGNFIDSLTLKNFDQIKNLVALFVLSCDLKELVERLAVKNDEAFQINKSVKKIIYSLTDYFYNNARYQKSLFSEVQTLKPEKLIQIAGKDTINLQELSAFSQDKLLQIKRVQDVLKIEADLFRQINIELLMSLLQLFYSKKFTQESAPLLLDCIQTCVDSAKKLGNIECKSRHPLLLEALKIVGTHHIFKAHRDLSFDTMGAFLKLIKLSKVDKFDADMLLAFGQLSMRDALTDIKPTYAARLDCFEQAYLLGKPCIKAQAALGLGFMYFYGEQNATSANSISPDYSLAEKFLKIAFDQTNVRRLKPHAAMLLGHMYHYSYGVKEDLNKALEFYTVAANQLADLPMQSRAQKEINSIRSQKDLQFFDEVD